MPAQWPTFINNISNKMASRTPKGPDDFGKFVANEYFKAVKSAQTPFGNIHSAGSKDILTIGFQKAFNDLFKSIEPALFDKFGDERFDDMSEGLPIPNYSYDPLCEIEKWTLENTDTLNKFAYHSLYPSTCPVSLEETIENSGINISVGEPFDVGEPSENINATFSIVGFDIDNYSKYLFKYSINGEIQPLRSPNEKGILDIVVPNVPGEFEWEFISVLDGLSRNGEYEGDLIKLINKKSTVIINEEGAPIKINNGEAFVPEKRQLIPEMTEEEQVDYLAKRIIYQNDKTPEFKKWVEALDNGSYRRLGGKILSKIKEYEETALQGFSNKERKKLKYIPDIQIEDSVLNEYVFQEEHKDRKDIIPEYLEDEFVIKFTYVKEIDGIVDTGQTAILSNIRKQQNKIVLYKSEKERWHETIRDWANGRGEASKKDEENNEEDPYNTMAKCIIAYWASTASQPFKSTPPVPPCNVPSPGTYIPIYLGSQSKLANDLRRAWNTGKRGDDQPSLKPMTKEVAAAVAVSCARHLLQLKYIYVGKLTIGTATVPMVGFVPTSF